MNNILDYVKPLVDEIYRREPDYDNNIVVQPDEIIIKETGQYQRIYMIGLTKTTFSTLSLTLIMATSWNSNAKPSNKSSISF